MPSGCAARTGPAPARPRPGWASTSGRTRSRPWRRGPAAPRTPTCWAQHGRPRFKGKGRPRSVEGKGPGGGLRWTDRHTVAWGNLALRPTIDADDPVVRHALCSRVKYVRLVRRQVRLRARWYVRLVCAGLPYRQVRRRVADDDGTGLAPKYPLGRGTVGLDFGPSTSAAVSEKDAMLVAFCQRRASNPGNYLPDGRVRPGRKRWHVIARQRRTEGAPGMFVQRLSRKAASAGGKVIAFPTKTTALSQVCQCGRRAKRPLSPRGHECPCGVGTRRDLYGAHLARFVYPTEDQRYLPDAGRAREAWPGAEPLLRAASEQAKRDRKPARGPVARPRPARGQSGSHAQGCGAKAEAKDVVGAARRSAVPESPGKAAVLMPTTPRL